MYRWRLLKIVSLLLLTVLGFGLGCGLYGSRSLPQVDGTIAVAGLLGSVRIIRDADAVPHIYAEQTLDVFFGLGYVHAQDRLWQMEFQRRVGQGRLSEILGRRTVAPDRFLRTLGVYRAAVSAWNSLPRQPKESINAYVSGINAFLATHHGSRLPPEFTLLGITPEPWTGPDVLVWAKMMAWDLGSTTLDIELLRQNLIQIVGPERSRELLPDYPSDGLAIVPRAPQAASGAIVVGAPEAAVVAAPGTRASQTHQELSDLIGEVRTIVGASLDGASTGSNSWVVGRHKSATGKPILANDPHLGARLPSTWYLAHLSGGTLDVIGATVPGLPVVATGRNRFISWGITNLRPDVLDLFEERLDPTGQLAEYQGRMEPVQVITETIAIKGEASLLLPVRITRHGPLISDALNARAAAAPAAGQTQLREPFALRWTGLEASDHTVMAFLDINQAHNWDEFKQALRGYLAPAQNFVYADVAGNIGYYAAGRIPTRARGDGALPVPGWTGDYQWTGWVPFEQLPQLFNPPDDMIVTANNLPTAAASAAALGRDWEKPYRAQRIAELLQAQDRLSPDDFAAIQRDTVSPLAQQLVPALLALVQPKTPVERQAVAALRSWDGDMRGDSAAAAIFAAWFQKLPQALVGDELGEAVSTRYQQLVGVYVGAFLVTTLQSSSSVWCDNITTPAAEDCATVAQQTLGDVIADLPTLWRGDLGDLRWDDLHVVVFPHQPLGSVPGIERIFNRRVSNGGDWSTINFGPYAMSGSFKQAGIPGYRQIIDLSQPDSGQFIQAIGQSGHVLSSHYADYLRDWQAVRYRPMRFEQETVVQHQRALLELRPRDE